MSPSGRLEVLGVRLSPAAYALMADLVSPSGRLEVLGGALKSGGSRTNGTDFSLIYPFECILGFAFCSFEGCCFFYKLRVHNASQVYWVTFLFGRTPGHVRRQLPMHDHRRTSLTSETF